MGQIVINQKEVPSFINKLYKLINLPEKCVIDKKLKSEFVVINSSKEKVISLHKLCRPHEHKRRLLLWQKKLKKRK